MLPGTSIFACLPRRLPFAPQRSRRISESVRHGKTCGQQSAFISGTSFPGNLSVGYV
jgi:hypothetical protein